MSQSPELKLLEEAPKHLMEKYHPLIQRVVLAHIQKSYLGEHHHAELLKGVQKRLPKYTQALHKRHGKNIFLKSLLVEACRMLCHHVEDIHLLQQQPNQLTIKYRAVVYSRVYSFVNTDQLRNDQANDIIQYVLEHLLQKFNNKSFVYEEGKALFRTYLYYIINNAIKDGLRRMRSQKASIGSKQTLEVNHAVDENTFRRVSSKLDIEKQCVLYGQFLELYKLADRTKFELSTKVNYAILLQNEDVRLLEMDDSMKVELLVLFGRNYSKMSKDEIWTTLVVFTNLLENKNIGADGLQKWFIRRRNWMVVKVLYIMNFDGIIQKKLSETEKNILLKISTRATGKLAEDYLGEIVYVYYG